MTTQAMGPSLAAVLIGGHAFPSLSSRRELSVVDRNRGVTIVP